MLTSDSTATTLTAAAAARTMRIGKRQMLALIHSGTIPAVRMGRQIRVRLADLDLYVASLPPVVATMEARAS
jgi:excisionase family DNA binding protein